MATSSIRKNFVISGKEDIEAFAEAVERSMNRKNKFPEVSYTELKGEDAINLLKEVIKKNEQV